nr:uncharacterized protein LOC113722766 [Coffea arabica]
MKIVQGSEKDQYGKLGVYMHEILRSNPGSTVIMQTADGFRDSKIGKGRFEMLYIYFVGVKHGFLARCRQFIGVDGTFLKGSVGGVLLAAIRVDANNGICPIAYAATEGENKDSWCWFFKLLKEDLKIEKDYEWTIMSDKQKRDLAKEKWQTYPYCPRILHIMQKNIDRAPDCFPFNSNNDLYEVSCPCGDQYAVNIKEQTSSCRKWELTVETYMKCYEGSMCPINGESEWGLIDVGRGPLLPLYGRAPGRPKKLRKRSAYEIQQSKEKTKKKVRRVGQINNCRY